MVGTAPGRSRTLAVWHMAQLMPTLGKPIVTFESPIGISWPVGASTPTAAYPPGCGTYSGKMRGSTSQIQYGTPSRSSVPTDPYRKCSSSEAKYGAGSRLKNFTYAMPAARAASTITAASRKRRRGLASSPVNRLEIEESVTVSIKQPLERPAAEAPSASRHGVRGPVRLGPALAACGKREQNHFRHEEDEIHGAEHAVIGRLREKEGYAGEPRSDCQPGDCPEADRIESRRNIERAQQDQQPGREPRPHQRRRR